MATERQETLLPNTGEEKIQLTPREREKFIAWCKQERLAMTKYELANGVKKFIERQITALMRVEMLLTDD